MRKSLVATFLAAALLTGGCMTDYVIPEIIDQSIDRSVTFADLKRDSDAHKGKIVVLGGVVLRARNLKEGTEFEVLQLPLSRYDQPDSPLEASEGRFMVLDSEHHDPIVLKDRRITLVGEVVGKKIATIDDFEYSFPYLSARFIHVWTERRGYAYGSPYYYSPYSYYPGFYPYGYPPYGYFGYYGPPGGFPPAGPPPHGRFDSPPQPPPPAPSNEPSNRRFER